MYPDFIFFHEVKGKVVADVVDPHRPHSGDTGPKWAGFARFASKHKGAFRRVLAVIVTQDDTLVSLDLRNPMVVKRLAEASNETDIRKVFEELGGEY